MRAAGIPERRQQVFRARAWDRGEGERAAAHFLRCKHRPTAVMAANEVLALGLHLYVRRHGLSLPRDLSIAGYAGELDGELVTPALTTVTQPMDALGSRAAQLTLELMGGRPAGRIDEELQDVLTLRASVGPPGDS
jgi:LacI family transcriptional regulator